MAPADDLERRISGIAALDQPLRRELYRVLLQRGVWVNRDEAAAVLAVPRSVAAFHLDKLVDAGVVEVTFERPKGRTGPGAGRPAKLYRRSSDEVAASVPDRHYDLAGSVLASAVAQAVGSGEPIDECLSSTAHAAGREAGEEAVATAGRPGRREDRRAALLAALARHGYEPTVIKGGEIALVNCPFHRLAEQHRGLVCGMNFDFLAGVVEIMGATDRLEARLEPQPGGCCVRIKVA